MRVCKLYDDATNTGCRAPACTPQGYCISHRQHDTTLYCEDHGTKRPCNYCQKG